MSHEIRRIDGQQDRVETGPTSFGDDWPGLFVRGDDARHYALHLRRFMDGGSDAIGKIVIAGLIGLLGSVDARAASPSTAKESEKGPRLDVNHE